MTILNRLRIFSAALRPATGLRWGHVLLRWATYRARKKLADVVPIEVLVDNSVLALAITHEALWVQTAKNKYLARVPVRRKPSRAAKSHLKRDYEDTRYLVGLAHLARLGLIRLRSAGELEMEQWSQPTQRFKGDGLFDYSLFHGIDIQPVDQMPAMYILPSWMRAPGLKEQQRDRLRHSDDPLFRGIVRHLGSKHSQDAWHIRTAEVHGLFCFLTTDYALCRNVNARGRQEPIRSLKTKVLTPVELGRHLGLRPLDPRYLSYDSANSPVRADLSMPDDMRRRRRKIRT